MDDLDARKFLRNRTATGLFAGVGSSGDLVTPDGLGLPCGHGLSFVEERILNFLGRGLGLALRLGQMENRLEQADLLLQLGDVAGFVGEESFERSRISLGRKLTSMALK